MSLKHINPPTLYPSLEEGYSQAIETSTGKTLYTAGILGADINGEAPDSVEAQAELAFKNLNELLRAADYTPAHLVRVEIYVVNYQPEQFSLIGKSYMSCLDQETFPPTAVLLGVQSLSHPGYLIEIKATACK